MPKPINVVAVKFPLFAPVLPVSSTLSVSLPLPINVNTPWMPSTIPPSVGVRLPRLTVFAPPPVFTVVIVRKLVLCIFRMSPPEPREMFMKFTPTNVTPAPIPKPVRLDDVNVPMLAVVSPVSSTLIVLMPPEPRVISRKRLLPPVMKTGPAMLLTVPPASGAALPRLNVLFPNEPPVR